MDYVDKYLNFLDGQLTDVEEMQFAQLFATDMVFRNNFRQYLSLTKSLSESSKYFTPANDVKHAVFSKLGLNPFAGEVAVKQPIRKKAFFGSKLFAVMSSSLLTFIVTYLLMLNNPEIQSKERNFYSSDKISNDKNSFVNNGSLFNSGSTDKIDKNSENLNFKNQSLNQNHNFGNIAQNNNSNNLNNKTFDLSLQNSNLDNDFENNNSIAKVKQSEFDLVSLSNDFKNDNSQSKFKEIDNDMLKYDTIFLIRSYDSKFRFEFKNTPSWFLNQPKLQPYEISRFNNLQISLFYPIMSGILFGADFRQETFYVEYDGLNSKGQSATLYQHPNLSTYSLSLRYNPFDFSEKIKTFVQFTTGANIYGIVTREMAGFEYYPFDNVYILLSAEMNQMMFKHQESWYDASKFCINYGLGIKF
jgi:hypothetical protein